MSAVFDLHCDTLTAFMTPGRCLDTLNDPQSAFALCRLPQGQSWAQCCAIFVPDGLPEGDVFPFFHTHVESFRRQGARFADRARICRTAGEAEAAWERDKAALFLTVENGAVLGRDLGRAEELARAGVVMVTLTWNGENAIGSGSQTDHGLTAFGREAVRELIRWGIVLDVSHLNDRGFWDLMEETDGPVAASHSNARAMCPHRRNLTDRQAREIARRGGLVGLNYYSPFLRSDGRAAEFEDVYRHAAHFLELGLEHCLALGSDFDGADLPPCLDGCEKVPELGRYLEEKLGRDTAEKILWKNAWDFFDRQTQNR